MYSIQKKKKRSAFYRYSSLFGMGFLTFLLLIHCSPTPNGGGEKKSEKAEKDGLVHVEKPSEVVTDTKKDAAVEMNTERRMKEPSNPEQGHESKIADEGSGFVACKSDCNCVGFQQVCEDIKGTKRCTKSKRQANCPNCSDASCSPDTHCLKRDGTAGMCPTIECKEDCACVKSGMVCDGKYCRKLRRLSKCPACSSLNCPKGTPCYLADKSVSVCNITACKHDCDCFSKKEVCDSGVCSAAKRGSKCFSCSGTQCQKGSPCYRADQSIGVCSAKKIPCKHDCDCLAAGTSLLCGGGYCIPLKRMSQCFQCSSSNCKPGLPCAKPDKTIGKCKAPSTACKHDCDCFSKGFVCHLGKCAPLKRLSKCVACGSSRCVKGAPCFKPDKSIGTCNLISCKHDCDCFAAGTTLLCGGGGVCMPLRRRSLCNACNSPRCAKGNPCYIQGTRKISICGAKSCKHDCGCSATEVCDATSLVCIKANRPSKCVSCKSSCKKGTPCRGPNGTLDVCCCTFSGCGSGQKCCSGGARPQPGVCNASCQTVKKCPLYP